MTDHYAMRRFHLLIALLVVCLDRAAKWAIARNIPLHDSRQIIPGVFRLTHVENRGAAFGLFADSPSEWKIALLVLFSMVALVIVTALLWRNSHSMNTTGLGLALILGGALGNSLCFTSANINGQRLTWPTARL
jgi:signal peptidase II